MPAHRAKALFDQFLATAVAEHAFGSATLTIGDPSGQIIARYERVVDVPSQDGRFYRLTLEQSDRCVAELIKDEAVDAEAAKRFALAQMFQITRWRLGGAEVPTQSSLSIHYGQLPCLTTHLQFETVEQFHAIQRVLADIGLCKLNEKHLKPIKVRYCP